MSLVASISDALLCVQVARHVWQDCRNTSSHFRAVATEVEDLEAVLNFFDNTNKSDRKSDIEERANLQKLGAGCKEVLRELQSDIKAWVRSN